MTKCLCCEEDLYFRWTDTHGIAVCTNCALPYMLYFYDNEDNRIRDKDPACVLNKKGIEIARTYWEEKYMKVFPSQYSFMPTDRVSYCGATALELAEFNDWLEYYEVKNGKS